MIKGIKVNGKHSYYSYGLRMLSRSVGSAPKDDHTERVPYSNITYDFDKVLGSSYGERTLSYTLELLEYQLKNAGFKLIDILNWLHWNGRKELYDDMLPEVYYSVREPSVSWNENHGVYTFELTFMSAPMMYFKPDMLKHNTANTILPDLDGDGAVTAADASAILDAYTAMSTGQDPGLTPEQLLAADADKDGTITAADASLVLEFYNTAQTDPSYELLTPIQAWVKFLNSKTGGKDGIF